MVTWICHACERAGEPEPGRLEGSGREAFERGEWSLYHGEPEGRTYRVCPRCHVRPLEELEELLGACWRWESAAPPPDPRLERVALGPGKDWTLLYASWEDYVAGRMLSREEQWWRERPFSTPVTTRDDRVFEEETLEEARAQWKAADERRSREPRDEDGPEVEADRAIIVQALFQWREEGYVWARIAKDVIEFNGWRGNVGRWEYRWRDLVKTVREPLGRLDRKLNPCYPIDRYLRELDTGDANVLRIQISDRLRTWMDEFALADLARRTGADTHARLSASAHAREGATIIVAYDHLYWAVRARETSAEG